MSFFNSDFLKDLSGIPESFKGLMGQLAASPAYIFVIIGVALLITAFVAVKKVKFSTRLITQIALAIALATVLSMLKIFRAPFGGSITIGGMVPIILMALVYGPEVGFVTGFLFGIVDLMLEPYIVHPVQLLFDYPFAFMALGLAGYVGNSAWAKNFIEKAKSRKISEIEVTIAATVVAILGRLVCHFISGVVFFAADTPKGMSVYTYSLIYNGSYLLFDAIICILIFCFLPVGQFKKMLKQR